MTATPDNSASAPATPENPSQPLEFSLDNADLLTVQAFRATFHSDPGLNPVLIEVEEITAPVPVDIALLFVRAGQPLPISFLQRA